MLRHSARRHAHRVQQSAVKAVRFMSQQPAGQRPKSLSALPLEQQPPVWAPRIAIWEEEKLSQTRARDAAARAIEVRVADQVFSAVAGQTTPLLLGEGKLARDSLVATVDGRLWDLSRPLEGSCRVEFLEWSTAQAKATLWHSSAHVLGQAMEYKYRDWDVLLCDGPALDDGGFFYDSQLRKRGAAAVRDASELGSVSSTHLEELTSIASSIIAERQPFERMAVSRKLALELFARNPFKVDILSRLPESAEITLYRCGPLIDLCRGPHLTHTGRIKAIEITHQSDCMYKNDRRPEHVLQRVYGIAFPDKKMLKEWKTQREEAKKRDHRLLGKQHQLFMFHEWSPGSAFFLPHGTRIYNTLINFLRKEYRDRGYQEVRSPLMYNKKLWQMSGHWENYKENMFIVSDGEPEPVMPAASAAAAAATTGDGVEHKHSAQCHHHAHSTEGTVMGLKPMNCPGHCLMFAARQHSYRDLPVRYADFSDLHRNETSGALTGLTRVRRFAQDDAHIFCTREQVGGEIKQCLDFVRDVYGIFGFQFKLRLSTRPEKYVGERAVWDQAEAEIEKCLKESGVPYVLNPGDGAFYGPKIDIAVTDALNREHQCATIQLDFQLPLRFGLQYTGADAKTHTPVMVHRAILGSVERMMAILLEHTAGKWPFWLSPRQVMVLPVSEKHLPYCKEVARQLQQQDFFADVGAGDMTVQKGVREAQLAQYNYILVVGDAEVAGSTVNVRTRDGQVHGTKALAEMIATFKQLVERKQ